MDESAKSLCEAVETLHGCRAVFREAIQIKEVFEGSDVWEGVVHVFELEGHSTATSCQLKALSVAAPTLFSTHRRH